MSVLLVVDDEPAVLSLFTHIFRESGIDVVGANSVKAAIEAVENREPDAIMLDVFFPDGSGLEAFERIRQTDAHVPVVMMTGGGDSETAIKAMQMGALDYLVKPLDVGALNKIVRRAIEIRRLMAEPVELASEFPKTSSAAIIGRSASMQVVYKAIGRVASQNISVLIRGESGTGKELVARAIFQFSQRKDKPFLAVNCAAIPEALLESELFGHEKGSFTGADRKRIGKFEQCHGGTLFLDEIGDMDTQLQSKLLRVLQEKQFQRVGGNETIEADVRIIAATHRNIEEMCGAGQFREDLFYRLNGFTIELPALRERIDDIEILIEFFRNQANEELEKNITRVESEAIEILKRYSWPGNVRELQSVVRQAIIQSSGKVLLADFLPNLVKSQVDTESISCHDGEQASSASSEKSVEHQLENDNVSDSQASSESESLRQLIDRHRANSSATLYDDVIEEVGRMLISSVLDETGGNQSEAAKKLGITRTTIRSKVNKLGIGIRRVVE